MTRSNHHGCQHTMCQTPELVARKVAQAPALADQLDADEQCELEALLEVDTDHEYVLNARFRQHQPEDRARIADDLLDAQADWERFKVELDAGGWTHGIAEIGRRARIVLHGT